jgi:hypothetical protein
MPTTIKKPHAKKTAPRKTAIKKKKSAAKVTKARSSTQPRVVKTKPKPKAKAKAKAKVTKVKPKATKPQAVQKIVKRPPAEKSHPVQMTSKTMPPPRQEQPKQVMRPVITAKPVFLSGEAFHDWHSLKREAAELVGVSDANEFEDLLVTLFQKSSTLTSQDVSRALRVLEEVVFVPQPLGFGGSQGFAPRRHKHTNIDHIVLLRAAMKAGPNSANIIQGIIHAGLTDARTVAEAQGRAGHFEREKMH